AYVQRGWHVDAVVCRDEGKDGDYFYEEPLQPAGVNVIRLRIAFSRHAHKLPRLLRLILQRIQIGINVLRLSRRAIRMHARQHYDVVYGYEIQGALAAQVFRLLPRRSRPVIVNRFQGSHLFQYIEERRWATVLKRL